MTFVTESDLESICGGCGEEHNIDSFTSVWDNRTFKAHYMLKNCEHCGYEISFRTTDSSGL